MKEQPKYLPLVVRHAEDVKLPPGVHHVVIHHADGCAHWRGEPCDCEPVVESGARVDQEKGQ